MCLKYNGESEGSVSGVWCAAGLTNVYTVGPKAPYSDFLESFSQFMNSTRFHCTTQETEAWGQEGTWPMCPSSSALFCALSLKRAASRAESV